MSTDLSSLLHTCPDCGGILEPSRSSWATTIDVVAAAAESPEPDDPGWRCLLCGYRHDANAVDGEVMRPRRV